MPHCALWSYDPTLYLDEIADDIGAMNGKLIKPTTLVYWIEKLKMTRKKLWRHAKEASISQEIAFWQHMQAADYHINQFIFIDESQVDDTSINRQFGYSLRNQRAVFRQLFHRGRRNTVTAAMDYQGILDYVIFDGLLHNFYHD